MWDFAFKATKQKQYTNKQKAKIKERKEERKEGRRKQGVHDHAWLMDIFFQY